MYKLNLEHTFCAAHKLEHAYSKECNENVHGHNWRVCVEIRVNHLVNGMIVDFKKIKEVINQLDHKNLNSILEFEPTAENLSKFLHDEISSIVSQPNKISITVYEADKASITYTE